MYSKAAVKTAGLRVKSEIFPVGPGERMAPPSAGLPQLLIAKVKWEITSDSGNNDCTSTEGGSLHLPQMLFVLYSGVEVPKSWPQILIEESLGTPDLVSLVSDMTGHCSSENFTFYHITQLVHRAMFSEVEKFNGHVVLLVSTRQ